MLSFKEIEILSGERTKNRKLCKNCHHSVLIPPQLDKIICSWCKNYVFKNDKIEFEYRMKEKMLKAKKEAENEI